MGDATTDQQQKALGESLTSGPTSILQDLLRDHNPEIGNWSEISNHQVIFKFISIFM